MRYRCMLNIAMNKIRGDSHTFKDGMSTIPLAIVYLFLWSLKPFGSWKVKHRSNFELRHFIAFVVMSTF